MRLANVNCKQCTSYGFCNKKRKRFFFFKQECPEIHLTKCDIAERYPKPKPPPAPPKPV
jgi:hypothetical protein